MPPAGNPLAVSLAELLGVISDDDGALSQVRMHELERRSRHRRPDVDEHEIDRGMNPRERFA